MHSAAGIRSLADEIKKTRKPTHSPWHFRGLKDYRKAWHTACVLTGLGRFLCRDCRNEKDEYVSVLDADRKCPMCGRKWTKRHPPKYEGRLMHDFRRSAAHELWKAGSDTKECMEVTGHATEAMFKRYADLFSDEERRAIQRKVQEHRHVWREEQIAAVKVPAGRLAN